MIQAASASLPGAADRSSPSWMAPSSERDSRTRTPENWISLGATMPRARARELRASRMCGVPTTETPAPSTTRTPRSEEHTSELQSLMRISYAVFCLKQKKKQNTKEYNGELNKQNSRTKAI